jgi:hypothetical protein
MPKTRLHPHSEITIRQLAVQMDGSTQISPPTCSEKPVNAPVPVLVMCAVMWVTSGPGKQRVRVTGENDKGGAGG